MTSPKFETKRLASGIVEASRGRDGSIFVSWRPYEGDEIGHARGLRHSSKDSDLPVDFPTSDDLNDYIEWAERTWGP
jgi:hypothetical protein